MTFAPDYVIDFDPAVFADGRPISTAQAWVMQNNARHLINQRPQCYVNWAGPADGSGSLVAPTVASRPTTFQFPYVHTWNSDFAPSNVRLSIWGSTTALAAVCHAHVRILPDLDAAPPESELPLIVVGADIPSSVPSRIIDTMSFGGLQPSANISWKFVPVIEEGVVVQVAVSMMRLEIELSCNIDEGGESPAQMRIDALQLWGFT